MKLEDLYSRLSPVLRPFGLPYSFIMRQRRILYGSGVFRCHMPACPCISIGNIAWGGTGKTPLTGWFLQWAEERGLKAVVLSRGYKGNPGRRPLLVRRDTPVEQSGDEPLLLARTFPGASVVVHPKRAASARFAENYLTPDLFILDDGMQHLGIRRHADIVLLRPEDLLEEWGRVIPSGAWREGCSALGAASVFAVKTEPENFEALLPKACERLARFGKPLFSFHIVPQGLRPVFPRLGKNHPLLEPKDYTDRPYLLVSGVGNSGLVEETATRLMGQKPARHITFNDHHSYTADDVRNMLAPVSEALPVVCTGKDAVKLRCFQDVFGSTPLWSLETGVQFGPGLAFSSKGEEALEFSSWWEGWWQSHICPDSEEGGHS